MFDPTPLRLKAEDSPAPDLQALGIELGELLQQAGANVVNVLHALQHSRDPFEAKRLALMWGEEAHRQIVTAMELRETLAREQRAAGLLSMPYGGVGGA
jgi:hypothetical protein